VLHSSKLRERRLLPGLEGRGCAEDAVSDPVYGSPLDSQVEALLQRVTGATEQRCASLRAEADSQANQIVKSARQEALGSVRKAIEQERSRLDQGLRQAQAHADLLARQHAQARVQELLAQMWERISGRLEARWSDPAQRRTWIEAALDQAGTLLRGHAWRIEHGPQWPEGQSTELEALARAKGAAGVEWASDPALGPGLRIRAEGVCVAATVEGLLARRGDIESAFLAEYFGWDGVNTMIGGLPPRTGPNEEPPGSGKP